MVEMKINNFALVVFYHDLENKVPYYSMGFVFKSAMIKNFELSPAFKYYLVVMCRTS